METFRYQTIPIASLAARYCLRFDPSAADPALTDSIRRSGIVQPLLVSGDARPEVIAGHRRLAAARQAGLAEVPALVLERHAEPRDYFLLAVLSNWNGRLDELDKAVCIGKAAGEFGFTPAEIIQRILPALGLEPQPHFFDEYLQTFRLQRSLLQAIRSKQLPFRGARFLAVLSAPDQEEFARLAAQAALTSQQVIQISEWLAGLLNASGLPLAAYLKREKIQDLLERPEWDRRIKGEKLAAALRQRAYPSLAAQEARFAAAVGEASGFSGSFKLEAPEFFEDQGYFLRAQIKNPHDLEQFLALLKDRKEWLNSLFDFML